jgi:hypothetical protein
MNAKRYNIIRYYQRDSEGWLTLKRGLTLDEAQAHCNDPETSSTTATRPEAIEHTAKHGDWFDGYVEDC